MSGFIQFYDSKEKLHILELIKIKHLHQLMYWKFSSSQNSDEDNKKFVDKFLEELYPDFTPYDREAAFVTAYKSSIVTKNAGMVNASCSCPKCEARASHTMKIDTQPETILKIAIPSKNPSRVVKFKNPTVSGGNDFGPDTIKFLHPIKITNPKHVEYGERIISNGVECEYTGFEDIDAVLRDIPEIDIRLLPADTNIRKNTLAILQSEHSTQIKSRMASAIDSKVKIYCPSCKYKETFDIKDIYTFISVAIVPQQILPDTHVMATLAEMGLLTQSECKEMSPFEMNNFVHVAEERLKAKAKAK